jgi:hypothetical protein
LTYILCNVAPEEKKEREIAHQTAHPTPSTTHPHPAPPSPSVDRLRKYWSSSLTTTVHSMSSTYPTQRSPSCAACARGCTRAPHPVDLRGGRCGAVQSCGCSDGQGRKGTTAGRRASHQLSVAGSASCSAPHDSAMPGAVLSGNKLDWAPAAGRRPEFSVRA